MPKNEMSIDKLKGAEDYYNWCFAMESFLEAKSLHECIIPKKENDLSAAKDDDEDHLRSAKGYLVIGIDKTLYVHIRHCKSALEIWYKLKNMYEDRGILRKIGVLYKFVTTKLENCSSMQEYVDTITSNAAKSITAGWSINDDLIAGILMIGLSPEYRPLLMSFEGRKDVITSEEVKMKLVDLEEKPIECIFKQER